MSEGANGQVMNIEQYFETPLEHIRRAFLEKAKELRVRGRSRQHSHEHSFTEDVLHAILRKVRETENTHGLMQESVDFFKEHCMVNVSDYAQVCGRTIDEVREEFLLLVFQRLLHTR